MDESPERTVDHGSDPALFPPHAVAQREPPVVMPQHDLLPGAVLAQRRGGGDLAVRGGRGVCVSGPDTHARVDREQEPRPDEHLLRLIEQLHATQVDVEQQRRALGKRMLDRDGHSRRLLVLRGPARSLGKSVARREQHRDEDTGAPHRAREWHLTVHHRRSGSAATARPIHPAMNATPPSGVIAPSARTPVNAIA